MQARLKIEGSPPGTIPWVLLLGKIPQTTPRIKKLVIYVSGNFIFVLLRGSCVGWLACPLCFPLEWTKFIGWKAINKLWLTNIASWTVKQQGQPCSSALLLSLYIHHLPTTNIAGWAMKKQRQPCASALLLNAHISCMPKRFTAWLS
jgi:hypothetical protein